MASMDDVTGMGKPETKPAPAKPAVQREHSFVLRVKRPDGSTLEGTCISRIPDTATRLEIGRSKAILAGGVAWESLDGMTRNLIDAMATVGKYLLPAEQGGRPEWFNKVCDEQPIVLFEVYGEVMRHEAAYFLGPVAQGQGAEADPVVSIVPLPGAVLPPDGQRWELRDPLAGAMGGCRGGAAQPPR